MDHFAGLDVSVKETSVCIVDDTGKIVREVKVASEPEALLAVLNNPAYHFKRIGLEAGPLSQWRYSALAEGELPVVCVETRQMQAALKAQINKTDRNDARGMAQMMRVGLYRPVHVKTLRSQKLRMLLTHRKLLQSKAIAIENDLRGTLRNFGLKVGMVGKVKFEARIKELLENQPDLAELVEPLLIVLRALREQIVVLHRRLLAIVRDDEVCRRLMTTPGVGPVVALTYRATVDVPARFHKSKAVGAVFGLTCSKYQSGEIDRSGRISRCGDQMMRVMLYEAAQSMLRLKKWCWLKAWAMQIARRRGMKKAIVAPGPSIGCDHASHLWTGHALQGDSNGMVILVRANLSGLTWELVLRAIMVVRTHLIFLFGRPLWAIGASRSQVRWGDRCAIRFKSPRWRSHPQCQSQGCS